MSDQFNGDDFEKVDAVQADQDLSVTSTSLTGEMAEEDRYEEKAADNAVDQLADFMSGGNDASSTVQDSEPLLSFEPVAEVRPSAPPAEPLKPVVETVKPSQTEQGNSSSCCVMKNVDPRDEDKCGSECGSVISSSDNEYSSSAEDSDTESSSDTDQDTMDTSGHGNGVSHPVYVDNTNSDQSDQELEAQVDRTNIPQQYAATGDCQQYAEHRDETKVTSSEGREKTGFPSYEDITGVHSATVHHCAPEEGRMTELVVGNNDQVVPEGENILDKCEENNQDNIDHTTNSVASKGMTDEDMSNMIEKLTKDEDVDIDTSVFKDDDMPPFENIAQFLSEQAPILSQKSGLENENEDVANSNSSENSDSCGEVECTDSDVSDDDDDNVGEWNPSPLYKDCGEASQDVKHTQGYAVLGGYQYGLSPDEDSEIQNLRSDVQGLMEEMETLTQENQVMSLPSLYPSKLSQQDEEELTADQITVIHDKPVKHGKSSLSNPNKKETKDLDSEDLCHVKFFSPTNMIFYDPDSPILERISVELSDELNDSDTEDRLKEVITTEENVAEVLENPSDEIPFVDDNLECEVVKDLKHVLEDVTFGAGDGGQEQLNMEHLAVQFTQDVLDHARKSDLEATMNAEGNEEESVREIMDAETNVYVVNDEHNTGVRQEMELSESAAHTEDHVVPSDEVELRHQGKSHIEHHRPSSFDERRLSDESKYRRSDIGSMIIHDIENLPLTIEDGDISHVETTPSVQSEVSEDIEQASVEIIKYVECAPQSIVPEEMVIGQNITVNEEKNIVQNDELLENVTKVESVRLDDTDKLGIDYCMGMSNILIVEDVNPALKDTPVIDTSDEGIEPIGMNTENWSTVHEAKENTTLESDDGQVAPTGTAENNMSQTEESTVECKTEVDLPQQMNEPRNVQHNESSLERIDDIILKKAERPCIEAVNLVKGDVLDKNKTGKSVVDSRLTDSKEDKRVTFSDTVVDEDLETFKSRPPVTTGVQKLAAMLQTEVLELVYWRDVRKTGVVFGSMLVVLVSLACFTLLSVMAYLSLAILTVTLSFRVYKSVMAAVQKTAEGHPFKNLLSVDLELRKDVVKNAAEKLADNINNLSSELRRLFLVQDYIDSLKFGLLLWLMTYVGAWFNGMTLVILAVVGVFTMPKVYDVYREPIDQNVGLVRAQLNTIMTQVTSKIPFPKKKQKSQ